MAPNLRPADLGGRIRRGRATGDAVLFLRDRRPEADHDRRVGVCDRRVPVCGAVSMARSAVPAGGAPGLGRCQPMTDASGAIYERFERVAGRDGKHQAVAGVSDPLTYAELSARSAAIANGL